MTDVEELQVVEYMSFIDKSIQSLVDQGNQNLTVVLLGDFNASAASLGSKSKVTAVHRLINDIDLVCCDDLNILTINYKYCHPGLDHKSSIDHISITVCHKEAACSLLVEEGACNSSFHNTICATICIADGLYIDNDVNLLVNKSSNMSHRKYLKWDDNMRRKFFTLSGLLLNELELMNLPCISRYGVSNDENHKAEVNVLCERIAACLQQARDNLYSCRDMLVEWVVISDGTRACQNLRNNLETFITYGSRFVNLELVL